MKSIIIIGQSTYACEVRDGIRYVNGMTVDDLLIKTKQIKAFRLGRSVRISWDEIDRYTNGKVDI